jgi:hypothetical protein
LGGNHPLCPRQRHKHDDEQENDRTITNPFVSGLTHSESLYEDALRSRRHRQKRENETDTLLFPLYTFPYVAYNIIGSSGRVETKLR